MNDLKQFAEVLFLFEIFIIRKCVEFNLTIERQ